MSTRAEPSPEAAPIAVDITTPTAVPVAGAPVVTTTTVAGDPTPTPASEDDGGFGLGVVAGLVLVAALVGAAVGALIAGRRRPAGSVGPAAPVPSMAAAPPVAPPAGPPAFAPDASGRRLIDIVVDVRDLRPNEVIDERLGQGLAAVGWSTVSPVGHPFDAHRHRAVDHEPTDDPALDGVVSRTERYGYVGAAGEMLRYPDVVVFRHQPSQGAPLS